MGNSPTPGSVSTSASGLALVVSVGDYATSNDSNGTLSTYALGTCVGVVIYDPKRKVGGLLHAMLPDSTLSPEKAAARPGVFVDTGTAAMRQDLENFRCNFENAKVLIAGGADSLTANASFRIGEKNIKAVKECLAQLELNVDVEEIGGNVNRNIALKLSTGEVSIKTPSGTKTIVLS